MSERMVRRQFRKVNARGEPYGDMLTAEQLEKTFGAERLEEAMSESKDGKRFVIDGRTYEVSAKSDDDDQPAGKTDPHREGGMAA